MTAAPHPGPRPLALHLALAAWSSLGSLAALPSSSGASPSSKLRSRDPSLAAALADPLLRSAADAEARRRLGLLHAGLVAYRRHPYRRALADPPAVWAAGTARLLDYGGDGPPVLLIPSLINRAYILDLEGDRSLVRWLAAAGLRPFLLDWGAPGPEERGFDLTDYMHRRLEPALDRVAALADDPVAVVGYCMGGLLALALAARQPRKVARLALLATPWDFHAGNAAQARALGALGRAWEPVMATLGVLPVDAVQALFALLDPFAVQRKFAGFAARAGDDAAAREFVALETWLNDGVPLAAAVARACLVEWYGANAPARGRWKIDGIAVRPRDVAQPVLLLVPERDRIVPPVAATALAAALPDARVLTLPLGHIGMVASRRAPALAWPPLRDFLRGDKRR